MTNVTRRRFLQTASVTAGALPFLRALPAQAASGDVLVAVNGQTINSLDLHRTGTNRPSYQVAINCYDRLLSFGTKPSMGGGLEFDYTKVEPELAESWTVFEDGLVLTFTLREATFQDGSPVTAADVKWSFDRAVSLGGFPAVQMKAGGFTRPDQFAAIDDKTFQITLDQPSKLSIPDLAVPVPFVINSKLALEHATDEDPWATEYLHQNTIGSGAYKVARWTPGEQLVYERFDGWASGPTPAYKRVIIREVPAAATRRAVIERGDAQLSFNIPSKDALELSEKMEVNSTPIANCINCVGLNTKFEPFQDSNVRKAVAYAIPYEAIFEAAAYGRGAPLWGEETERDDIAWPRRTGYVEDLEMAKDYLAKSGYPDGFEVPFSISLNQLDWMEPTALLIQENLAKIGITVTIDKIPGADWRTASLVEKRLAFHLEGFGGWLDTPDYYFFWAYKDGHLFNSSNYRNEEIEALVDSTLHIAVDDPAYAPNIKRMFEIALDELPRIPLWQPALNVALNGASDYEFWFHRQLDVRPVKPA
ncbi:MAG: ABC transporter substrate-binding protein [Mangrovicoccus sp.]